MHLNRWVNSEPRALCLTHERNLFFSTDFSYCVFLVKMCRLFALFRLILPEESTVKRFAAARLVLIFGMIFLS